MEVVGRRTRVSAHVDLSDDLAVEVSNFMRKHGIKLCDLKRFGYSDTSVKRISCWLRGTETGGEFGVEAALRLAERLRIPVRYLVGDEARPETVYALQRVQPRKKTRALPAPTGQLMLTFEAAA